MREMDIKLFLNKKKKLVDEALERFFPYKGEGVPILRESMRYSLFAGGKRLRPILALTTYEVCGGKNLEEILPQACALEMIHTFTLIHDDLPAIDNDVWRRGRLTNHKIYGEALAILAGDALFIEAINLFLKGPLKNELKARMLLELTHALGVNGVIGGQVLDINAEGKMHSLKLVQNIHRMKTAKFIEVSMVIGGIAAEASENIIKKLHEIGENIGFAFQIVDDILDETGEKEVVGKETHKDRERGKCTYPSVIGLERSKEEALNLINKAKQEIEKTFGQKGEVLKAISDYIYTRIK